MDTLTLSAFEPIHLAGAFNLSRAATWPHRLEDWALLLSISKGVVVLDAESVLATALVTPMGAVATASMIIVDASRRGAGLGRCVVEAAMARISPREWRLIATQDGLQLYERMGFKAYGNIVQMQGIAAPLKRDMPQRPLATQADLAELIALDQAATGMERQGLYAMLLAGGSIFLKHEHGQLVAFAGQRHFGLGVVIGPVIARNMAEAQSLIEPLIVASEGQFVRIDTDEDSGLAAWLPARGLVHVGGGVKMRKGKITEAAGPQRRYALAAQSLG